MNKIYRVVWNKETNTWTAVCEYAKSKGKSSSSSGVVGTLSNGVFTAVRFTYTALVSALILVSGQAMAATITDGTAAGAIVVHTGNTSQSAAAGQDSTAIGTNAKVTGATDTAQSSIAFGSNATVTNAKNAIAFGTGASSDKNNAISIGNVARATGQSALAVGDGANATNGQDTAVGVNTVASGNGSSAFGYLTKATGYLSTAVGNQAQAKGNSSIAVGKSVAGGANSISVGNESAANGQETIAIGKSNNVSGANTIVIGSSNVSKTGKKKDTDGTSIVDAEAGDSITAVDSSIIGKANKIAVSSVSGTPGNPVAALKEVHVHGNENTVNRGLAYVFGSKNTINTDATQMELERVLAVGHQNTLSGKNSIAVGHVNQVSGSSGVAVGVNTHVLGTDGVALGNKAYAGTGENAIALGGKTHANQWGTAVGARSAAMGDQSVAVAAHATAKQNRSLSIGSYSYSGGSEAVALGHNTMVADGATSSSALGAGSVVSGRNSGAWGAAATSGQPQQATDRSFVGGDNSYAIGNKNIIGNTSSDSFVLGNEVKLGTSAANLAITNPAGQDGTTNASTRTNALTYDNTTAVTGVVALGSKTSVTVDNGVALGKESVANTAAGQVGKDPLSAIANKAGATWTSTLSAISVGDVANNKTRQMTGVAAGTQDTDAVNVAQLKAAGFVLATTADTQAGGTATDSTPTGATGAADKKIINGETLTLKAGKGVTLNQDGAEVTITTDLSKADKTHYFSVNDGGTQGGNYNNDGATASGAVAVGVEAGAIAENTVAVGKKAQAADSNSISIGRQSGSAGVDLANKGTSAQVADRTKAGKTNASGLVNVTSIGNEAGKDTINNNYGVNIGYQAGSGGYNSTYGEGVAIGNKTGGVDKTNTTVKTAMEKFSAEQGATDNAIITGNTNTAISSRAGVNALGHDNVAIGKDAGGYSSGSSNIAIGRHAGRASKLNTPNNEATRVIDGDVFSNARNTISMGEWANASGNDAVAIGRLAQAPVEDSIAIGRGVKTELLAGDGVGDREGMIAIGSETTKASGKAAISIGRNAQGIGRGTVALGDASQANSGQGIAIGAQASVAENSAGGIAVGSLAKSSKATAVAIGTLSSASANHAVALGKDSEANRTALTSVTISNAAKAKDNQVYALGHASEADKQAVGATVKGNLGAVSVGTEARTGLGNTQIAAATRQIINVAAGSEDSDAVNVAQLKAVANQITPADNTTIVKNQTGALKVNTAPITVVAAGEPNAGSVSVANGDEGKLATAGDIANAINNSGFTLTASGRNGSLVKSGATVDLKNTDGNIVISKADDSNDVNFDLNEVVAIGTSGGSSRIIIDGRGNIGNIRGLSRNLPKTQSENTAGPGNPSNVTTKQTLPDNVSLITSNAATVGDVLNVGWNVQTNGDATDFVRTYDTVNFADGVGTTITSETDGNKTTFKVNVNAQGLAESAQLPVVYTDGFGNKVYKHTDGKFYDEPNGQGDQIAPGDIVATMQAADGSVVKPTSLTNVAAGANDTDAVNVSQLKGAVTALGGGAQVNLDGSFKAPTYTLTDGNPSLGDTTTYHNVGDALAGLNTAVNQSLSFSGDAGDAFDRKLGSAIKLTGGVTESTKLTDNNIGVVAKDGILDIKLAKDIDLGNDGSVTTGDVQVNNEGLTIIDGPSITKSKGINAGNKVIADVASNLPTTQNNTAIQGSPSNATKVQEAPTNADTIKNNAATVGDVLNAGWNVQTNGDATDFVRTYDTVNFADGVGTTITSETDGNKTTFKVNVNAQNLAESAQLPVVYTNTNGDKLYLVEKDDPSAPGTKIKVFNTKPDGKGEDVDPPNVIASMQNAASDTKYPMTLTNVATGVRANDAVNVSQLGTAGIYETTQNGDIVLENGAPKLKGLNFAGNDGKGNTKLGDTWNIVGGNAGTATTGPRTFTDGTFSGGNIKTTVKDGVVEITMADSPKFGDIVINNQGKITGVANGDITAISKDVINGGQLRNTAGDIATIIGGNAEVDDAGNVTASNIGGTSQNNIHDAIKTVKTTVKSTDNSIKVTANTADATNGTVFDISVNAQGLAESAQLPVVYTKADGTKVYKVGDKFFDNKAGTGTEVPATDIIASMQNADGTITPTTLANIKAGTKDTDAVNVSQLKGVADTLGGGASINADGTINAPTYNITNPADGAVIKAQNVGDALNALNTAVNNPLAFAGDTGLFNRKLGQTTTIKGGITDENKLSNSNIGVVAKDGALDIKLAKDIAIDSVTTGNTTVNNDGITIKAPANGGTTDVKLTANGLNNGGNKITNVAEGTVDTDAVNFAQLKEVQKTAKAAKTEVQAGNNMAVTYSTGADGQTIYNVATKPDVLFDSVTVGTDTNQVVLDDTGVKVGGNTYISGTGLNANNKKVTNVAKGDVSANSKDAINGSQLHAHGEGVKNIIGGNTTYDPATGAYTNADIGGTGKGNIHDAIASINTTANAGWNVQTNAGNKTNVKPSDTVNFIDGSNIKITNDGTNITVATADDLTVNSVTAGNTVVNNAGVKVGDVQITAGGINAGNQQITNLKSGLNGKTLDNIKADASAPERSNAATIGDLATVQNNVTNITHNYNTVIGGSSADGKVLDSQGNVVTDNQGNSIDVADALKTYNVQDNKAKTDNTIITAIKNMNEGGIKFFHVNDGTGEQNIAGTDTHKEDSTASGKFAAAVGYEAQSTGENALAFGKGSQALAKNAIAIGTGNIVRGENSGAIGDPSIINGANSYSVGNNNTVATNSTFVLGNEVTQTVDNSVFLGDKSSSTGVHTTANGGNYTYAGANDANVAGVSGSTAPVGVVSVGTEGGQTRQIQNVAAGVVSANSTDAINGSQLYYTNEAITNVANNTINMGNQLNNRINDVADDANAGVSSAMAMASLPQAYLPGKSMITGGVASYNGEGAVAVGLSKLSDNGRWVLKISGSADTQGNAGGSIGAGFHF